MSTSQKIIFQEDGSVCLEINRIFLLWETKGFQIRDEDLMKFNPSMWISLPGELFPNHPCIKYKERLFTYSEINERANKLAWGLMNRGITKGTRVATLQHNSNQCIELFLAMWKSGIIMVPLNTRNSAKENVDILMNSEATVLIFGSEFIDQIGSIRQALPSIREFICHGDHKGVFVDYESILANSDLSEPNIEVEPVGMSGF